MDAWVYHSQRRTSEAAEFVERLRVGGEYGFVRPANSRYYEGEVHKGDVVYHDGSHRLLAWNHEEAGVDLRLWTEPTLNQEVADPVQAPTAPVEEVRHKGPWFTAYRDGVKVGTSKRTEAKARAELRGGRA